MVTDADRRTSPTNGPMSGTRVTDSWVTVTVTFVDELVVPTWIGVSAVADRAAAAAAGPGLAATDAARAPSRAASSTAIWSRATTTTCTMPSTRTTTSGRAIANSIAACPRSR